MHLEIFSLCDAATVSGGKLNILGAFDTLQATKVPSAHPQCSLAMRMRFSRLEEGLHQVKINFVDADGKLVIPSLDGKLTVNFRSEEDSAVANFIINIHPLKLQTYGSYSFDIAIDGDHKASLPLIVKPTQSKQTG